MKARGLRQAKEKAAELSITHRFATVYDDDDNYLCEIENMNWENPGNPPAKRTLQKGKRREKSSDQHHMAEYCAMNPHLSQTAPAPTAADWLVGGGEMGRLIRSMDWAKTPLGPIELWPQSLRTTVSLCLASNFPIALAWGPSHVQIYNDGYLPICGSNHPRSMGQDFSECWASVWPAVGPAFARALAGETSYLENQRMFTDRNGYPEESFFTFSFSPIRDESGAVGGLFHPVTETTSKMLSERRTFALRDLTARTAKARTSKEACTLAALTLADHDLDLPFVLIYSLDDDGKNAQLAASSGLVAGKAASPEKIELATSKVWALDRVTNSGLAVQVENLQKEFGPIGCGSYPESPKMALALPIIPPGAERPAAVLIAGISPRLPFNEVYRGFCEQVAFILTAALANAQAFEEGRKRAEKLAELDRAKTTFFSNVSHEFRTPLMLMLGPLEEALNEAGISPEQRLRLDIAHRNSRRLLKLVNILLDFSRIEAGRAQASYEPLDLALYTAELASVFRSTIEKAGMELVVDCPPLPEQVFVDRDMWEKIVLNLMSNAFKFTEQGRITIHQRVVGGCIEMAVEDTGNGIPANQIENVFKRFYRIEGARGRTHEGTGIGLALVQELAKLHGGAVRVECIEKIGCTFTVSIPLGKEHLPADRILAQSTIPATNIQSNAYVEEAIAWLPNAVPMGKFAVDESKTLVDRADGPRPRVLLADDNADMREYVRRILAPHYEVCVVADGEAAIAAVRVQTPDLVLSDIMMPRLDGLGLLRELRSDPDTRAVPVIFLSARAGEESRVEGLEAGADDYLVKPFSSRELLARVRSNLELARIRSESARSKQEALGALQLFEAVRDSEVRFRTLANAIPQLCWMANADGWISWYNERWYEYTGTTPEEMEGWGWQSVHDPVVLPLVLDRWKTSIATGRPFDMVFPLRGSDGVFRPFLTRVMPECNRDGKVVRWFGTNTDVTERELTKEELRQAKEAAELATRVKNQFLANMSHELRTPMTGVLGMLDLAIAGPLETEQREFIETARTSARALVQILNDILDLTKIEAGKLMIENKSFSIRKCIEDIFNIFVPVAKNKGLGFCSSVADDVPETLVGDVIRLEQILTNLVGNAVKFTEKGAVVIGVVASDGAPGGKLWDITFSVADTGIGIPDDKKDLLFRIFSQVDDSHSREYGGTGLGLAICKEIVVRMGGVISFASEEGRGSTFSCTIPFGEVEAGREAILASGEATLPRSAPRAEVTTKPCILIAEDDPIIRKILGSMLQRSNYDIELAENGQKAVAMWENRGYDLIVMDVQMPRMNGFEATAAIREKERTRGGHTPIVAMTAHALKEDEEKCIVAGMDAYVSKPIDFEKTLQLIGEILKYVSEFPCGYEHADER